jgi:hypothetical protein
LAIALIAIAACAICGCKCTPPERIEKAIEIMNAGTTDYVTHCQPLLTAKIAALNEAAKKETDPEKKAKIDEELKQEIEYFKLGKEIPPTMQELEDWAKDKPVDK